MNNQQLSLMAVSICDVFGCKNLLNSTYHNLKFQNWHHTNARPTSRDERIFSTSNLPFVAFSATITTTNAFWTQVCWRICAKFFTRSKISSNYQMGLGKQQIETTYIFNFCIGHISLLGITLGTITPSFKFCQLINCWRNNILDVYIHCFGSCPFGFNITSLVANETWSRNWICEYDIILVHKDWLKK